LEDLSVENDTLPFSGELPILSSYNTDLHLYCKHGSAYNIFGTKILSAGYYNMGKIDMTFALLETDFDGQAKGVELSDDLSDPFCFDKADTEVTELNLNSKDIKLYKCDYTYFWPTINVDPLCELILQYAKPTIFSKAESEVKIELKSILSDNFKQCGVTSVAPPNPLELTVDWGMADGQYVTAYSGRTYLLEAYVGANQDSFSSEHVIFTDGHPEEETSTLIVAARIRSIEESNLVTALWTPDKLGETQLYVDASRLNEQTDEVEPAVLRVRVLPAEEDPSSSQDIIPLVDSQGGGGNSNCFIATAAYGSYWEPHVRTLRQFRDSYLLTNKFGAQFVEAYYKYSPPMANYIAEHDNLRSVARVWLAPLVGFSWLAVNYGMIIAFAVLFGVLTMIIGTTCLVVNKREAS
jgi:hypothetical protein